MLLRAGFPGARRALRHPGRGRRGQAVTPPSLAPVHTRRPIALAGLRLLEEYIPWAHARCSSFRRAYLASWLRVLKEDKRAIFSAATHASKATAYLHDCGNRYIDRRAVA